MEQSFSGVYRGTTSVSAARRKCWLYFVLGFLVSLTVIIVLFAVFEQRHAHSKPLSVLTEIHNKPVHSASTAKPTNSDMLETSTGSHSLPAAAEIAKRQLDEIARERLDKKTMNQVTLIDSNQVLPLSSYNLESLDRQHNEREPRKVRLSRKARELAEDFFDIYNHHHEAVFPNIAFRGSLQALAKDDTEVAGKNSEDEVAQIIMRQTDSNVRLPHRKAEEVRISAEVPIEATAAAPLPGFEESGEIHEDQAKRGSQLAASNVINAANGIETRVEIIAIQRNSAEARNLTTSGTEEPTISGNENKYLKSAMNDENPRINEEPEKEPNDSDDLEIVHNLEGGDVLHLEDVNFEPNNELVRHHIYDEEHSELATTVGDVDDDDEGGGDGPVTVSPYENEEDERYHSASAVGTLENVVEENDDDDNDDEKDNDDVPDYYTSRPDQNENEVIDGDKPDELFDHDRDDYDEDSEVLSNLEHNSFREEL